jgi:hypothetical protein
MAWLRKSQDHTDAAERIPASPAWVPASMRPRPDPALSLAEDPEADDDEMRFIASLVEEVDADAVALRPGDAPPALRPRRVDDDAVLSVFRDSAPEYDPYEGVRKHRIPEVEIVDLVDELSTTAAALRRRRAA